MGQNPGRRRARCKAARRGHSFAHRSGNLFDQCLEEGWFAAAHHFAKPHGVQALGAA
ncbi:hypothetical protein [Pseudomonas sp. Irchel s3h14]|uniref:hypothetical protein n=1 Tax=Pseudomonas TaxID=286 RepID=UPI003531E9E0